MPNGKPLPGGEEGAALKNGDKKVVRTVYSFERDLAAGASTGDFELSEDKPGADERIAELTRFRSGPISRS